MVDQVDINEFRATYGKGKSGMMDNNEIIRQLTDTEEEGNEI